MDESSYWDFFSASDRGRNPFFLNISVLWYVVFLFGLLFTFSGLYWLLSEPKLLISTHEYDQGKEKGQVHLDQLSVDVSGAVVSPGVYLLDQGSRIDDVLRLAGGFREDVDIEWVARSVNRAQRLSDGMKIFIPSVSLGLQEAGVSAEMENQFISINHGTKDDLLGLTGIGEVTAQKIIDGRPYSSVEELVVKKIVKKQTMESLRNQLVL